VRSFGIALMAAAITAAVFSLLLRRKIPGRPRRSALAGMLRPLIPIEVAVSVTAARDCFTLPLLSLVIGTTAAGLFSWAYTVAQIPVVLVVTLAQPLLSAFARLRDTAAELGAALSRSTRLVTVATVGLAVPLCAAAEPLTRTVFSPKWLPAHSSVWILSGGAMAYGVGLTLSQAALVNEQDAKAVQRWQILGALVFWGAGLPLAGWLDDMRAYAAAYVAAGVLYMVLSLRYLGARLELRVLPAVLLTFTVGAIAAVAGALAGQAAGGQWLGLFVAGLGSLALYGAGLLALAQGPLHDDVRALRELVRRRPATT
jgi:O-antigen/teichoic acid export membrane protein